MATKRELSDRARREYAERVEAHLRELARSEEAATKAALDSIGNIKDGLRSKLAGVKTIDGSWDVSRLPELQNAVNEAAARLDASLAKSIQRAQGAAYKDGISAAIDPVQSAIRVVQPGFKIETGLPNVALLQTLQAFGADLVTEATADVRAGLTDAVKLGVIGVLRPYEVAEKIDELMGTRRKDGSLSSISADAERIARTEVGRAFVAAQFEGAKAVAIAVPDLKKKWVATSDARTRDSHAEADGQIVPLDEPFVISGRAGSIELMYPRDPSGPPEEVVSCRCSWVQERDDWAAPPSVDTIDAT